MSRKFDYLGDVEVFIAVVEHGSFTGAAVALSSTPSVLSRAITRLEARLGRQLLQRTTRRVGLTEAGRVYLEQARSAFSLLDDAERIGRGQEGDLTGRVRMSVPTTYAHYRLPPLLAHYNQRYPRVQVELNITNRNVDLIAEGFDLAIRLGQLPDSGLVARKLEDAALLLPAGCHVRGLYNGLAAGRGLFGLEQTLPGHVYSDTTLYVEKRSNALGIVVLWAITRA
ncbi:hypothetical protein L1887_60430 [Cichorium endivia]|nr:hypothetical protein L1887_60430 [Cichorium endivia]